jgi:hypothetical protein
MSLKHFCASVLGFVSDFGTEATIPAVPLADFKACLDAVFAETHSLADALALHFVVHSMCLPFHVLRNL